MFIAKTRKDYIAEIIYVRDDECLAMINRVNDIVRAEAAHPEAVRLMAVPMLYSVWERCFSIWTSLCLKSIRESTARAVDCPPEIRAFWLRKADFFKSFIDIVRDVIELEREDSVFQQTSGLSKKITKGGFHLSSKVLGSLDAWHQQPFPSKQDVKDLVLTYSNVNDAVVTVNAEALGLAAMSSYQKLDLSKLGGLVGMRNAIGHGASFTAPGSRELNELIEYTRSLITQYAEVVIDWLNTYALPDPEPEVEPQIEAE
ncbi:HEPN domain-containing protein [Alcaligenes sp. Marseille-Q7550]